MREFNLPRIEKKPVVFENSSTEEFLSDVAPHKKIHFMSRSGIAQPVQEIHRYYTRGEKVVDEATRRKILRQMNKGETTVSKFVLSLHTAFAKHIPFSLSPQILMSIITQEVAQYVKDHSEDPSIASLFTRTPGEKPKIVVEVDDFVYGSPNNDWLAGIEKFRTKLTDLVPSGVMEYMTPRFSDSTLETEVVHLVSFMDAASKYYDYGMSTMCGVPSFRIEGTADDWDTVIKSVTAMAGVLPGLTCYFKHLTPILREIRNTADGNKIDNDFWASIYKQNHGSGGPYSNGWFNNLYAHVYGQDWRTKKAKVVLKDKDNRFSYPLCDGNRYGTEGYEGECFPTKGLNSSFGGSKLNNFPSNLSVVDFEWNYLGTKIPMAFVGGITSVEMNEGFLTPRLGISVLEKEVTIPETNV